MTRTPKTIDPQTLAGTAITMLNEHNIGALVVIKNKMPVGVVHFHDLLRIGAA